MLTKLAVLLSDFIDRGVSGQLERGIVVDLDIRLHDSEEDEGPTRGWSSWVACSGVER